jgi:RHS repeat-associated protein
MYLQGPNGPMYRRGANVADVRWYVYDGLGSVLGEVDVNGNLTSTKKHDAYGLNRGVTGTPTSKHGFVGDLGHTNDDEIGLLYMRARYYDASLGRFTSEDKGYQGANWYWYCGDNPVNFVDENGTKFDSKKLEKLWKKIKPWYEMAKLAIELCEMLGSLHEKISVAKDPIDVENAWAEFMADWNKASNISNDDKKNLEKYLKQIKGRDAVGIFRSAVTIGMELAALCYGYSMRMEYYVNLE